MANKKHLTILNQGADVWNKWRENNPGVTPDLRGANLKEKKLAGCDFSGADIRGTNFKGADLESAKFVNSKAGLKLSSFLLRYLISLFFSALFSFFSVVMFVAVVCESHFFNIKDEFSQIAIGISFSIFFLITMTIRRGQFYLLATATALVGLGGFPGVFIGEGAVSLAVSLAAAAAAAAALGEVLALLGAGTAALVAAGAIVMIAATEGKTVSLAVAAAGISIAVVMCYIGWRTLKEDGEFAAFREFGLSFSSWGGTNFRSANLHGADFTGAFLKGACFDKETDLTNVCWKNALKAQFAQFSGTIMDICFVRELLVNPESSDNGTTREVQVRKFDDVLCEYVYPDENGEAFYKNIAAINEDLIERFIEFPPEYHQAGISVLNYFGKVLKSKYPDTKAKIKIEQDGLKVKMVIDPADGGDHELIEKTLGDYGRVISGQMSPEEFTDDRLLLIELKSELRMAQVRIETQQELLNDKSVQIDKLLSLVGQAVQNKSDVTVRPLLTKQAKTNQEENGMKSAEKV